jgi:L-threonylcarbamoyladenylate synthase
MEIIQNITSSILYGAATALKNGNLVVFPTETVYGLGGDAINSAAVARIYKVKARPKDHPLIVHISSIYNLDKWARKIPDYAINLAQIFWPGPMTLILPRTKIAKDFITGGQDCVGIRVPDQEIARSLLREFEDQGGLGIAAPSANRFRKISPTSAIDAHEELGKYLENNDFIFDGGDCQVGVESTIIDCRSEQPKILRPGAITVEMIQKTCGLEVLDTECNHQVKVSGAMGPHYAPVAKVLLSGSPKVGDGFIATADLPTPRGAIRLASPRNNLEYAQQLYRALRLADLRKIKKIYVVPPLDDGLGVAIKDRLAKAAM